MMLTDEGERYLREQYLWLHVETLVAEPGDREEWWSA